MKRAILFTYAFFAALPLALCAPVLKAQSPTPSPNQAIDASRMPESGPAVVGGSGATVGPNSKNQAVMPMPGLRQNEEQSELPRDATLALPEVRPAPGPSRATPAPTSR